MDVVETGGFILFAMNRPASPNVCWGDYIRKDCSTPKAGLPSDYTKICISETQRGKCMYIEKVIITRIGPTFCFFVYVIILGW